MKWKVIPVAAILALWGCSPGLETNSKPAREQRTATNVVLQLEAGGNHVTAKAGSAVFSPDMETMVLKDNARIEITGENNVIVNCDTLKIGRGGRDIECDKNVRATLYLTGKDELN